MPSVKLAPKSDPPPPSADTPAPSAVALESTPPGPIRLIRGMVRTVRPHQWMKNVFVLAPVVIANELFDWELLVRAGGAFFVFCLLAGAVYTINDIVDAPSDRVHPVKRHRPIAAGVVPINVAKGLAVLLFVVAMAGALYGPPLFALVGFLYFVQNIAYSFRLKKITYADVGCIALGFVLRVMAGGLATRIHVSSYLLGCTALLALFLGFGKRSHELAGVSLATSKKQRAALEERVPVTLAGPSGAVVEADEGLLEQALINLVRNAADASLPGGSAVHIGWSVDERGSMTMTVVDSGPGIADDALLFVPLFTTKPAGTGIGLVLSREIIESHDGHLTLGNRRDSSGCVATIVLPRARVVASTVAQVDLLDGAQSPALGRSL